MNSLESRRVFLGRLVVPVTVAALALSGEARAADRETNYSLTKTGVLTAYATDKKMNEAIANRFGLREDFFLEPQVKADICSLRSLEELKKLQYWSQPLIETMSDFNYLRSRQSDHLLLYLLQSVSDPERTRPLFIAPDTYNFYSNHAREFIGSMATIRVWQRVNQDGQLADHASPRTYAAWIMDVRAKIHHDEFPPMLADGDPSTVATITGAYWNNEKGQFFSQNGNAIHKLPSVELEIPRR